MKSPIERFSDRADSYAKYRPDYPTAMVRYLKDSVPPPAIVADIGSGTGILTGQLLKVGYEVFAVEPNRSMALAAERDLGCSTKFHAVAGMAEATTLRATSIDLITCAQSFHWFAQELAKSEFRRILRPGGSIAIIWNERVEDASEFQRGYEAILKRLVPEYQQVGYRQVTLERIEGFFAPEAVQLLTFPHPQLLTRETFLGRVLSSSYVPNVDGAGHSEVMQEIGDLFDRYEVQGRVRMEYQTRLYWRRFSS